MIRKPLDDEAVTTGLEAVIEKGPGLGNVIVWDWAMTVKARVTVGAGAHTVAVPACDAPGAQTPAPTAVMV